MVALRACICCGKLLLTKLRENWKNWIGLVSKIDPYIKGAKVKQLELTTINSSMKFSLGLGLLASAALATASNVVVG
jgi:O-succinylbenzoate synthase